MMATRLMLTSHEEAFVQALDDLRLAAGLGMGRFARALGGISIDTMKSLLYRRRRPSPVMVAYVDQWFRNYLQEHPGDRDRALMERIIAAAHEIPH